MRTSTLSTERPHTQPSVSSPAPTRVSPEQPKAPTSHWAIRGVSALNTVERGVARLRALAPEIPVTARTTLHRQNFRELPAIVEHARAGGFDSISFLAADLSSGAFGRVRST